MPGERGDGGPSPSMESAILFSDEIRILAWFKTCQLPVPAV